ncbi:MAG: hypothetical protein WAU01_00840 [Saprospiraceae bacterium]
MSFSKIIYRLLTPLLLFCMISCEPTQSRQSPSSNHQEDQKFTDYWYAGEAELNRYQLDQVRYGENHPGEAVLIFVTEDFWADKQVKYEHGDRTNQVKPILKLNFTRKFFTGIYPYSLMSSIFTPIDTRQKTLKITTTAQEWCGHSFSQLNLKKDKYDFLGFSYFQDEADQKSTIQAAMLEDEVWNKIRLNPSSLPTGDIELIPGGQYLRLNHKPIAVEKAFATMKNMQDTTLSSASLTKYTIKYKDLQRELSIVFETSFPYAIVAWEEHIVSGNKDPKPMITKAVRTHTIKSAYWSQNGLKDADMRAKLGMKAENY